MRKTAILLAFILMFTPLSGCWDMKEINSQAYIFGIGMDSSGQEGIYSFTFQRAVPVGIDSSADSNSIKYENITVDAPSLAQAVRDITLASSMEFSFVHLSCVIIGSELAHSGFAPLLEYLMQQSDVRRQCIVAVAADTARSLLDSRLMQSSSSAGIAALLEELDRSKGHTVIMTLSSVSIASLTGRGYCLYTVGKNADMTAGEAGVSASDSPLSIAGAYIFSPAEFVGTIDADQADTLRLFAGEQNDGMISAAHDSGKTVYFWIERSECRIDCEIIDDQLFYDVRITAYCSIADTAGLTTQSIHTDILEKSLYAKLDELIKLSQQELGAAFLGMEDAARQSDHRWYTAHRESFGELYRNAVINLDVSCQLERSGVIN